jgi:hypothetical protein
MIHTKWNGIIFGGILGMLLAIGGCNFQANPGMAIFLIVAINLLHYVVPPTKGPFGVD